ncbi:MAG: sigma-70 family RNA polymerase sigma factor [Gemmatimonadetes bacterium]|nr:sigma-70 family RNA polymerase sigma factor [Gemmatimonadota bacterium]
MANTTTSGAASATYVDDPGFAARIRVRDAQALEEVVRRYLPQILRAARGAGFAPQLAEDVAQDTFVTFVETAPRFEGRSHVRTWLFGILYKKIAAARRSLGRDNEMDDIEEVFEQRFDNTGSWTRPPRPVDAEVYDAEVRQGIDGCLDRVPTNQRMAFVLREIEGMDTQEMCKILEVTRTNLGVLLHRVRNRLRDCLEAKGIEP